MQDLKFENELDIVKAKQQYDKKQASKKYQEAVDHPEHYGGKGNPYEVIKIIEAHNLDFHRGNSIKYILRAGKKAVLTAHTSEFLNCQIEDYNKAIWYLERAKLLLINGLEECEERGL